MTTSSPLPMKGILNQFQADPSNLRILILSCPKTGNTWLSHLLSELYHIPVVELGCDQKWDTASLAQAGRSWVCRQHFTPQQELVEAAIRENIVVISTFRHPGDTLVSYINYIKWWREGDHAPEHELLAKDKGEFKSHTYEFLSNHLTRLYNLSLTWHGLGAHAVRYEDLLADPVGEMQRISGLISPVHEYLIKRAVLLCAPENLVTGGRIDARFINKAKTHQWMESLPEKAIEILTHRSPFREASQLFGYTWDKEAARPSFDYASIDPFEGKSTFDNGVEITPILKRIYTDHFPRQLGCGSPTATHAGTFWSWLLQPCGPSEMLSHHEAGLVTNLLWCLYQKRSDLKAQFPNLFNGDGWKLALWFCTHGVSESKVPWELAKPINIALSACLIQRHQLHKARKTPASMESARATINGQSFDFLGGSLETGAGELLRLDFVYQLEEKPQYPVLGITLRTPEGATAFGTNSLLLNKSLQTNAKLQLQCSINIELSLPMGRYLICVGLADKAEDGKITPLLRTYDACSLLIRSEKSLGMALCKTEMLQP